MKMFPKEDEGCSGCQQRSCPDAWDLTHDSYLELSCAVHGNVSHFGLLMKEVGSENPSHIFPKI